jgi:hypothetical protein
LEVGCSFLPGVNPEVITKSRDAFITLYERDPKVAQFVDSFVGVKTFNELLGEISKRREELVKLIGVQG